MEKRFSDEWVFLAGTYDSSKQRLYANGSELQFANLSSASINVSETTKIGRSAYGSAEYFGGNLANIAIWNRALHPDEINAIMWKSYADLNIVDKNGLQAWYALDDINGTTVPDSTGNHNGTAN